MNADSNTPVYFDCSLCGECCSSWNIPIEAEKARHLLEKPWVKARLEATRRQLQAVSDSLYRIPLTDENVCVFLAEDRRCLIEANEGLSLKPHECQRFPFATIQMPDGTRQHDTSAACKRISERLLLAFQPILPKAKADTEEYFRPIRPRQSTEPDESTETALREILHAHEDDFFDAVECFPARIAIGLIRTCPQAGYERWHRGMREIFSQTIYPEEALRQARQALPDASENRAPNARGNNSDNDLDDNDFDTIARAVPPPHPSRRNPGHRLPYRGRLADWLTLFFLRKPYRSLSWVQLLGGRQYEDPRLFGLSVDLQARAHVRWDEAVHPHINAFLYNIVSRKLPLARGMSLVSLLAMAGCAGLLVRWYAVTLASLRGGSQVTIPDVTGAIRLTERYYTGHQPRFLQFFHSRWKGWLIGTLFGLVN